MGNEDYDADVDTRISGPLVYAQVVFHNTNEFKLTANSVEPDVVQRQTRYCRGFQANAEGLLWVRQIGGSTDIPIYVLKGCRYAYPVGKFLTASAAALKATDALIAWG